MKYLFVNNRYAVTVYRAFARWRACLKYDVRIGRNAYLDFNSRFEGRNVLLNGVEFTSSCLGMGSYVGNNSIISYTRIGRFCAIGDNVRTCLGLHPTKDIVSIHPAFYSSKKQAGFTLCSGTVFNEHRFIDSRKQCVAEIGNDVWIANNVSIMDGVRIGDGAVIGFGSLVNRDIAPYSLNVGSPAKEIGHRFTADQRVALLEFKWWNRSFEWIREHADLFVDIEAFVAHIRTHS